METQAAILFYSFLALVAMLVVGQLINLRKAPHSQRDFPEPKPAKPKTHAEQEAEYAEAEAKRKAGLNAYYEQLLEGQELINRDTTSLEDFIINSELTPFDLEKLAQLNGIMVGIEDGWYPLALELMQELDKTGWNRKVGTIKEKYGELRFYAETKEYDLLDRYAEASTHVCEVCGEPGKIDTSGGWWVTRCPEHLAALEDV